MRHILRYICRVCSIRSILFVFMLLFTVIPTLAVFFSFKSFTLDVIADKYLNEYLMSLSSHVEYNFSAFEEQLTKCYLNLALYPKTLSSLESGKGVDKLLETTFSDDPAVSRAEIITQNGIYSYSSDGKDFEFHSHVSSEFIDSFTPLGFQIMGGVISENGTNYIVTGRPVHNYYSSRNIGYILFYTDENYINSLYRDLKTDNSSIFISVNGHVISHDDNSVIGKELFIPESVFTSDNSELTRTLTNRTRIKNTFSDKIDVISIVSYDDLFGIINSLNRLITAILIIAVIFMLFVSMIISKNCMRAVGQLNINMAEFSLNPQYYTPKNPRGEIAALENRFNEMVKKIKELMRKNEEEREKKHIAELCTYQAQIKHHFVYNALDIIYWKAHEKSQPEIEKIVLALASFFRISLSSGDNFIKVSDEISHVKNYLIIEQMRFDDMFEWEFDISDEITDIYVLKIILQPVVENCIKHGFKDIKYKGKILIKGYLRDKDTLVFDIIDNGRGLEKNPLTEKPQSRSEKIGYGLFNIDERLRFEYGKESKISFLDTNGKGTHVEIVIKLKNTEKTPEIGTERF